MSEIMAFDEPLALILGEPLLEYPKDLYIPPEALKIFLSSFEGPLDLLLYLIRKNKLDILNVPIAEITKQYTSYMDLMQGLELELVAEYLVMAAVLAEIKSRLLLPKPPSISEDQEVEDRRAELVRRLQEYQRFKEAAQMLDDLPQMGRELFAAMVQRGDIQWPVSKPVVDTQELLNALAQVMKRAAGFAHHQIHKDVLSVRERMSTVLNYLQSHSSVPFESLFDLEEGRMGIVVTFIAILELLKQSLIELSQSDVFESIHIKGVDRV